MSIWFFLLVVLKLPLDLFAMIKVGVDNERGNGGGEQIIRERKGSREKQGRV